jgi:hypothetical protein
MNRVLNGVFLTRPPLCEALRRMPAAAPRVQGPDVSYLDKVKVGDNQRNVPACVMFSWAKRAEIVDGIHIPDADCVRAWELASDRFNGGRRDQGLTLQQGHDIAKEFGWVEDDEVCTTLGSLDALADQPIVAAYRVTPLWEQATMHQGLVTGDWSDPTLGYHAVCIAAHGVVDRFGGSKFVMFVNSWSAGWGWKGLGAMSEATHTALICEMVASVKKGRQ